jgi:hypothetical protein
MFHDIDRSSGVLKGRQENSTEEVWHRTAIIEERRGCAETGNALKFKSAKIIQWPIMAKKAIWDRNSRMAGIDVPGPHAMMQRE